MALTLKEKHLYRNQVYASKKTLSEGGLSLKEASTARRQLREAAAKLRGDKAGKTLYERIRDGEFNNLEIGKFVDKVREALKAINGDGLQESKDCATQYMKAHYDSAKQMFVAA